MPVSDSFLDFILDQLASWGGVSSRKMFGGVGLFREGKIFGLIADDVVYLKVDDSNRDEFEAAGSEPFKPFPDKPNTMSYYEVPADILDESGSFVAWAQKSLAIQFR